MLYLAVLLLVAVNAQLSQTQYDTQWWPFLPTHVDRPFITDFTIVNNGTLRTVWSGAKSPANSPPSGWESVTGNLEMIVSPTNMCQNGGNGQGCHPSPNRINFQLACTFAGGSSSADFSTLNQTTYPNCTVTTDSVISLTVNMTAFSSNFSWTWMNGVLLSWDVYQDSYDYSIVRLSFKPVLTPMLNYTEMATLPSQCCTCDYPSNCPLMSSSGYTLGAGFFSQVSGSNSFDNAIFATTNSLMGAMAFSDNALSYRLVSSHYAPDGSLLMGSMIAVLPMTVITQLYPTIGNLSAATSALSINRTGSDVTTGNMGTVQILQWTQANNGMDAIVFSISGIGFSTPTYTVTTKISTSNTGGNNHGSNAIPLTPSIGFSVLAILVGLFFQ